jgi:FkbM family methyltransferase
MYELVQGIKVRANNNCDKNIALSVITYNEYRLPSSFEHRDVIVDVGAHVGSFTFACMIRGAGKAYTFEPDQENFMLCETNLKPFFPNVYLTQKAVWRSDTSDDILNYTGYSKGPDGINCGGGNVLFENGINISVQTIALDSVLSRIDKVRLLKLDCEASEWPILFTSRLLNRVEEIVGEYHEIGGNFNKAAIPKKAQVSGFSSYTIDHLVLFLSQNNFTVETTRVCNTNIGLFFAKKKNANIT